MEDNPKQFEVEKFLLASLIFFLVLPSLASALVLEFEFKFHKSGKVELLNFSVKEGKEFFPPFKGNWTFKILSGEKVMYENSFQVIFYILSDPPVEVNETLGYFSIPYEKGMNKVQIYRDGKLVFEKDFGKELCNKNGKCEGKESYYTCEVDCPSGSKDGFCDALLDGKCDPDCEGKIDPDCTGLSKVVKKMPTKKKIDLKLIALISGGIGLVIIAIIILRKILRKRESEPNYEFESTEYSSS